MKGIFRKFNMLPGKKKAAIVTAAVMTLTLAAVIPVYAWFYNQRKAAELYKVEFPNSLYLNAAHREDRMYFNLNAVSQYKMDPITNSPLHDEFGKLIPTNSQKYVFTVSGSNTQSYKLQLAHTNNNQFTYTIYPAEESTTPGTDDKTVVYPMHAGSHNENTVFDPGSDNETGPIYYIQGDTPLSGSYKNNESDAPILAKDDDSYYIENYDTLTNVEENDIPSYWQSETIEFIWDLNKKFCHYYILEVTWDLRGDNIFENKETDMVYITASR